MKKTLLIIKREYFSRVKKKSFLILTFLVPLLIIGMYALIIALAIKGGDKAVNVEVIDQSKLFEGKLKNSKSINFKTSKLSLAAAKQQVITDEETFVLYIPEHIKSNDKMEMLSQKKAGIGVINDIENQTNEIMRIQLLKDAGINSQTLDSIKPNLTITTKEITIDGEKDSSSVAAMGVGFAAAILIYMSLMIYGSQVMRGIIEEKTNRIIEVVISSVRPFQLMMGKIIGIGLVGLTQFLLWIILSLSLTAIATNVLLKDKFETIKSEMPGAQKSNIGQNPAVNSPAITAISALQTVPFNSIIPLFLMYFLGGYLLYSALFAAVGSAVDSDTETQQFMFPITLPLLFTYIMSFSYIINNPDSTLSIWLSIIPFTSPIAMMVRLPFGVPDWQLAVSILSLIAGFFLTTWVASRIYRIGILMYGKKASFKELIKWFSYKE
ncbi:MAG: ABC-type Na+ efflux pump permease component-like protein [Sphingobacteriales bacterium]|nr:ABC-type Na+ efflux pump permease component-like protein [Sphingobacteriales bacterium]